MERKANVLLRKEKILKSVSITSLDKPEISQVIIEKWQNIIDLIAKIMNVPSGLIMQITEDSMQVFLKSRNPENPYKEKTNDKLGHGLYCETVIGTNAELLIDNALNHKDWHDNPDVKLNMTSYCGLPIQWPDESFFGTICVLDNKENAYTDNFRELIMEFKHSIEKDLELICQKIETENALKEVKKLSGLLPICSYCHKIRDDKGYWNQIEAYIQEHSEARFSHGICKECAERHYPEFKIYKDT